jgi:hypothetical protein
MTMTLHPQYITDEEGRKISVVLSVNEFEQIMEELDELEDIRLYDEAKKDKEPYSSFDEYVKKRGLK